MLLGKFFRDNFFFPFNATSFKWSQSDNFLLNNHNLPFFLLSGCNSDIVWRTGQLKWGWIRLRDFFPYLNTWNFLVVSQDIKPYYKVFKAAINTKQVRRITWNVTLSFLLSCLVFLYLSSPLSLNFWLSCSSETINTSSSWSWSGEADRVGELEGPPIIPWNPWGMSG